ELEARRGAARRRRHRAAGHPLRRRGRAALRPGRADPGGPARRLRPPRRADQPGRRPRRRPPHPRRRDRRPHDRRSMMTAVAETPVSQPRARQRSAFRNLVTVEARLMIREVVPLLWGAAFPMVLLSVIGEFSGGPENSLGGFSVVASYVPVLIVFTCSTFALQGLPAVLTGYRERGILRRLNATPVGAGRLLGAQL